MFNKKSELEKKSLTTSKKLAKFLLKKYNVATLPGSEFGMPKRHMSLRISPVDYDGTIVLNEYLKNKSEINQNPTNFVTEFAPNLVKATDRLIEFTYSLISD